MFLRSRRATIDDLIAARETLGYFYGNDPEVLGRFGDAWEALIGTGAGYAVVVEDVTDPARPRPLAHGGRVFITEPFADELRSGTLGAPAASAALRNALAGGQGIATPEAQEGQRLTILCLHMGFVPPFDPCAFSGGNPIETLLNAYFHSHRGYRFGEMLKDVFGEEERRWFEGGGMRLRTQYGHTGEPSPRRPYLMGITREETLETPGTRMASMFVTYPRRLGLTASQRELITMVLEGRSDEEVAAEWCVTLSAVKKRWQAIYDAVDRRLPGLLPASDPFASTARGAERRRHLLSYVREHPEELVFVA